MIARTRDLPTATELGIEAELWNALTRRVSRRVQERTGHRPLFSTRNRAAIIAVMALDAATDEWLVGFEARLVEDGILCGGTAAGGLVLDILSDAGRDALHEVTP